MSFLEDDIVEQDIEHHYGISPFRPPAIGEEKQPNARRVVDGHRSTPCKASGVDVFRDI